MRQSQADHRDEQEIASRPFCMWGSPEHVLRMVADLTVTERAYTAFQEGNKDQMLILLNDAELGELRSKGYIITVQANPMYGVK